MTMTDAVKTNVGVAVPSYFPGKQWQQVLGRDASADGQFVYAVKSTKVYCKPSCASRRPSRKNVTFFPTPALAEAAGYRACKRCEPERTEAKADPQAGAIAAVTEYLKDHAEERTRLADVAKATGVGRLTILRGFKRVLGVSPGQYAKEARLERFKSKVREPKKVKSPITNAIYEAGFGSSSRLYEKSSATLGMTPRVMREGGAGLLIRYCTVPSPLGRMLVAMTDRGICSIAFGKDDKELVAGLREQFSKAQLPFQWMCERLRFNSGFGRRCRRFREERLEAIPRLRCSWVRLRLRGRWRERVVRIRLRLRCLVIGWWAKAER
jgi:AraC family transcriptional regulator, regulatory protein of adaptative response / methylated-DNA-[protein]-cysteine methyltransferase